MSWIDRDAGISRSLLCFFSFFCIFTVSFLSPDFDVGGTDSRKFIRNKQITSVTKDRPPFCDRLRSSDNGSSVDGASVNSGDLEKSL